MQKHGASHLEGLEVGGVFVAAEELWVKLQQGKENEIKLASDALGLVPQIAASRLPCRLPRRPLASQHMPQSCSRLRGWPLPMRAMAWHNHAKHLTHMKHPSKRQLPSPPNQHATGCDCHFATHLGEQHGVALRQHRKVGEHGKHDLRLPPLNQRLQRVLQRLQHLHGAEQQAGSTREQASRTASS